MLNLTDLLTDGAAACRVLRYFDEHGLTDVPLFVSGTLVDQSGRTLSGQTTEVRAKLLFGSLLLMGPA